MICDLAETYHVTNYRSLPPRTVAAFVAGLRDNSRLVMKATGVTASQNTLLLASITDRLGLLLSAGGRSPESMVEKFIIADESAKREHIVFDTPEELMKVIYGEN